MKEFFQSLAASWKEIVNYLNGVLSRALEMLSLRASDPVEAEEPHGGRVFRVKGAEEGPRRVVYHGPTGWRVHVRRLERGRSGTHRHEWRQ
ncbi:MAG: hypothetical protein HY098_08555 [Nitrospinae bacterium]|nr:hypothetical protein [Nitrospinota bacterium]